MPATELALFFDGKTGLIMWRCLRCRSEHSALGHDPCHSIRVGGDVVGLCCESCRELLKDEIRSLTPELSCHGIPPGENDPGWPDGTPDHIKASRKP